LRRVAEASQSEYSLGNTGPQASESAWAASPAGSSYGASCFVVPV